MPQTVRFVRFEGDRVTQLRIAALGKPIVIHDQNEMRGYLDPEKTRTRSPWATANRATARMAAPNRRRS